MTKHLSYRISGSGDPVVFLPGFMEDSSMWDNLLPAFQHHRCILIDLHGHGKSFFNPALVPSIAVMAEQVRDLLDELQITHYQLVGHSMGGYVGCRLLDIDPGVEHLTLLHSHPWADTPAKKEDRNRVIELVKTRAAFFIREAIPNLFAFPEEHRPAIAHSCAIAERMLPAAIAWSAAAMRDRPAYTEVLKQQSTKVSIIQGQLDPLIPNLQLHAFADEHGIGFYEIPQCGHVGQEEAPEQVKELLSVILG
jgi:pimeloyl-ACP methyl ester carboxylesterase